MGLGGYEVPDGLIIAPQGELAAANTKIEALADEIQFPITSEPNRREKTNIHGLILYLKRMQPHFVTVYKTKPTIQRKTARSKAQLAAINPAVEMEMGQRGIPMSHIKNNTSRQHCKTQRTRSHSYKHDDGD